MLKITKSQLKQIIKEELLINESFNEKKAQFIKQGADPGQVKIAFDQFKQAKDKGFLEDNDKNIDKYKTFEELKDKLDSLKGKSSESEWDAAWSRFGGQEDPKVRPNINNFKSLVDKGDITGEEAKISNYETLDDLTKKIDQVNQLKQVKKDEYEIIRNDKDTMIIQPLTQNASCVFGSSNWCTAYVDQKTNKFDEYTKNGVKLIYIIDREDNIKFALAIYPGGNNIEAYDKEDVKINAERLISDYSIPDEWLRNDIIFDTNWLDKKGIKWKENKDNGDGSIDIMGDLDLSNLGLTELPFLPW